MNMRDPKLIALQFNECIKNQEIEALARLMAEDHTFIDREGKAHQSRESMVKGWKDFFGMFPKYKNSFTRIESRDDLVVILGFAYWSETRAYDLVIWTATVVNDLVREWRVYADTEANGRAFNLI